MLRGIATLPAGGQMSTWSKKVPSKGLTILTIARASPPTWKSVTLSVEKSTVKLPHGAVASKESSNPIVGGKLRRKWAFP